MSNVSCYLLLHSGFDQHPQTNNSFVVVVIVVVVVVAVVVVVLAFKPSNSFQIKQYRPLYGNETMQDFFE